MSLKPIDTALASKGIVETDRTKCEQQDNNRSRFSESSIEKFYTDVRRK